MMKALFLIEAWDSPSSRVRVLDLIPGLEACGIEAEVQIYGRKLAAKLKMFQSCRRADVVFVQKKIPTLWDGFFLRQNSRKLVYDFDDAVYFRHESHGEGIHKTSLRRFANFLPKVDLTIAGNEFLAREARKFTHSVEVIPSTVHVDEVPCRNHAETSPIVIGWIGGVINLQQANLLAPVLQELATKTPIEFRVISGEPLDFPGVPCRFIQWEENTQHFELAKLDIGVMPLPDSLHAWGKCGYKALQYMSVGVPAIVSDVGVNRDIVQHGKCGYVAKSIPEFGSYLLKLAQSLRLRKSLGAQARARVEDYYSLNVAAKKLKKLLTEL
jgi:glycosyltransferase involved in cell wall biosynthesis